MSADVPGSDSGEHRPVLQPGQNEFGYEYAFGVHPPDAPLLVREAHGPDRLSADRGPPGPALPAEGVLLHGGLAGLSSLEQQLVHAVPGLGLAPSPGPPHLGLAGATTPGLPISGALQAPYSHLLSQLPAAGPNFMTPMALPYPTMPLSYAAGVPPSLHHGLADPLMGLATSLSPVPDFGLLANVPGSSPSPMPPSLSSVSAMFSQLGLSPSAVTLAASQMGLLTALPALSSGPPPSKRAPRARGPAPRAPADKVRRTVYISDIDQHVTEAELAGFFSDCGELVDCRICGDTNSSMRFAFIEYRDVAGTRLALSKSGSLLGAYPIRVSHSKTAIVPVNDQFLPRSTQEREQVERTVYIANVDRCLEKDALRAFFEAACGPVAAVRVLGDVQHSTKIAFLEFEHAKSARAALKCSGTLLGALPLRVSPSKTAVRAEGVRRGRDRVRGWGAAAGSAHAAASPSGMLPLTLQVGASGALADSSGEASLSAGLPEPPALPGAEAMGPCDLRALQSRFAGMEALVRLARGPTGPGESPDYRVPGPGGSPGFKPPPEAAPAGAQTPTECDYAAARCSPDRAARARALLK